MHKGRAESQLRVDLQFANIFVVFGCQLQFNLKRKKTLPTSTQIMDEVGREKSVPPKEKELQYLVVMTRRELKFYLKF